MEKYKIVNIEFGVNYIIEGYGKELIRFFEYWQKNEFQTHPGLSYSRKACRYKPNGKDNNYKIVKSYSKGIQHPMFCDEETNRFEIKSKESKYCKSMGVSDVSDLIKISSYKQMGEELIKTSKQVLILDHKTEFKNLNEAEQVKLRSYLSGHTWYEQTLLSKNMFGRMKDRYMCLLDKTGFNVNSVFQSKIQSKVSELLGVELSPLTKALIKPRGDDSNIIISGIVPPLDLSTHYCQLTGINLKHEGPLRKGKGVPKYIRSGTINYLRRNDLGVYYHLQSWLIPKIDKRDFKLPKSAKSMKNHMCHVVRNRYASKLRRKANLYKQGYDLEDINKCLAGGTYLELISEHANELICE
ncbi:MAG: hypothetical protein ABJJ05_15075 [Maribacter litoralis]|uniref:hypothetical protein n=1 Tax=Maribacter litoralis TaxID=2059726 RepID=UPI0032993B64